MSELLHGAVLGDEIDAELDGGCDMVRPGEIAPRLTLEPERLAPESWRRVRSPRRSAHQPPKAASGQRARGQRCARSASTTALPVRPAGHPIRGRTERCGSD